MTFSEVCKTAKACLQKYEPSLKVRGKKPYDNLYANHSLCVKHECLLRSVTEAEIEGMIGSVLEALAEMKDGFVMSGPRDTLPITGFEAADVTHHDLSLSLVHGYDINSDKWFLRVNCWYYPA